MRDRFSIVGFGLKLGYGITLGTFAALGTMCVLGYLTAVVIPDKKNKKEEAEDGSDKTE